MKQVDRKIEKDDKTCCNLFKWNIVQQIFMKHAETLYRVSHIKLDRVNGSKITI